jgi:hypothetical protein
MATYFLLTCLMWNAHAESTEFTIFKYQHNRCLTAVDKRDGAKPAWAVSDMKNCGFDLTKPTRTEFGMIAGNRCAEFDVYVSANGHGEVKNFYPWTKERFDLPKEKCGYDMKNPVTEYRIKQNECNAFSVYRSTHANMPELSEPKTEKVEPSNCGFKPENERTAYELRSNKCLKLRINMNTKGERIVKESSEVNVRECGIDLNVNPSEVVHNRYIKLMFGSDECHKISYYDSSTGLGSYYVGEKVALSECPAQRQPGDGRRKNSPPAPAMIQ